MHESCYDFDLCENCEALPIPVHPTNHPMLKIRTPDVVIPTVLLPGEIAVPRTAPRLPSPFDLEYAVAPPSPGPLPQSPVPLVNAPMQAAISLPAFTPTMTERSTPMPRVPLPATMESFYPPVSLNPFHSYVAEYESDESTEPLAMPPVPHPVCLDLSGRESPVIRPSPPAVSPVPFVEPVVTPFIPSPPRSSVSIAEDIFQSVKSIAESTQDLQKADTPFFDLEENDEVQKEASLNDNEGTTGGISTPSDVPASTASTTSVPKLGPVHNELWSDSLWPDMYSNFRHLLNPPTPPVALTASASNGQIMPGAMFTEEPMPTEEVKPAHTLDVDAPTAVVESPLVGEPLLCRPLMPERPASLNRSLSDLIGNVQPVEPVLYVPPPPPLPAFPPMPPSLPAPPPPITPFWQKFSRPTPPFSAEFVSDNNIPLGQIFPPGAEFVKSWRMRNDGTVDWPESTELMFVAGDRMMPFGGATRTVKVGSVKPGEEVELVSGEMKVGDSNHGTRFLIC